MNEKDFIEFILNSLNDINKGLTSSSPFVRNNAFKQMQLLKHYFTIKYSEASLAEKSLKELKILTEDVSKSLLKNHKTIIREALVSLHETLQKEILKHEN
jgi:hypothetical protein